MDRTLISAEGFPGTREFLEFNEQSFLYPLKALCKLVGNGVRISTAELLGAGENSIFPGTPFSYFITYQGEIVPFTGAAPSDPDATVVIKEIVTEAGYDTSGAGDFSTILPVWKKYRAEVGNPADANVVASFAWSSLISVRTLKSLNEIRSINGGIVISNTEANGFNGIATGAITAVEIIAGDTTSLLPKVKVHFENLGVSDYVPIIELANMYGGQVRHTQVVDKTPTSFSFRINSIQNGVAVPYFTGIPMNIQIIRL